MTSIKLTNVCLDFPIYNSNSFSLKHALVKAATGGILRKRKDVITVSALKNVSFSLQCGDRLGLIGHNGSGKTTLLKLLGGIYSPTSGQIHMEGKSSTLFDMLMGTYDDMTGYENIYLSSLIRGKSVKEAKDSLKSIGKFTELEDYLYVPMRTYSSGMKIRVGFAVAAEGTSDILLIDEVFGAGDQNFVHKSSERVRDLIDRSGILVFSSHSEDLLRQLCNKIMVLEHGEVKYFGEVEEVLHAYKNA